METADVLLLPSTSTEAVETSIEVDDTIMATGNAAQPDDDQMDAIADPSSGPFADGNSTATDDLSSAVVSRDYSHTPLALPAKPRGKRRRRKSKTKHNKAIYNNSSWRYQLVPPSQFQRNPTSDKKNASDPMVAYRRTRHAPYNTNDFLMDDHRTPKNSRTPPTNCGEPSSSSNPLDSDDRGNYYCTLPFDEEAFLSKEFSNVYESARSERLEAMTKSQLMREYLQLEANYDKLSRNLEARKAERDSYILGLEEQVCGQGQEILDLRRQLTDSRNRRLLQSNSNTIVNRGAIAHRTPTHIMNGRLRIAAAHSTSNSNSSSADSDSDSTDSSTNSDSDSSLSTSEATAAGPPGVAVVAADPADTVSNGDVCLG